MIVICTNSPLPTFASIQSSLLSQLPNLEGEIGALSGLMGLKSLMFSTSMGVYRNTQMEIQQLIQELLNLQRSITLLSIIKPIVVFIGGVLEDFLPKVMGINLLDLLTLNPQAIYDAIEDQVGTLFETYAAPAVEIVFKAQEVVETILQLSAMSAYALINQALDILNLDPFFNSLLSVGFPTMDAVVQAVKDNLMGSIPGANLAQAAIDFFMSNKTYFNPELDAREIAKMIMEAVMRGPLEIVLDFIQNTLGNFISFTFPTICVPIPLSLPGQPIGILPPSSSWMPLL